MTKTKARHSKDCVFAERVHFFERAKNDRPATGGSVTITNEKLTFRAMSDEMLDIVFHFCPECGAQLQESPYPTEQE